MIIGGGKEAVIRNIQNAVETEKFNSKVEVGDPDLSPYEKKQILENHFKRRRELRYFIYNSAARAVTRFVTWTENRTTEVVGAENLRHIKDGAIITSNHYNHLDILTVRAAICKLKKKRLFIVSQETNLAMTGYVGFFMKYADIIPVSDNKSYMAHMFFNLIKKAIGKKQYVLIYPEQEMWFNYRKPRPGKRGAYFYAAKLGVPIISCFVEIRDLQDKENDEFYKTKYVVHILQPIYPDSALNARENSFHMMEQDYVQKKNAYEKAYGKKLTYNFESEDIAGWIPKP